MFYSCVQVIVIEKGCVVEQGTHSELLACDGVYKQLVMRQLTAGEGRSGEKHKVSNATPESEVTSL